MERMRGRRNRKLAQVLQDKAEDKQNKEEVNQVEENEDDWDNEEEIEDKEDEKQEEQEACTGVAVALFLPTLPLYLNQPAPHRDCGKYGDEEEDGGGLSTLTISSEKSLCQSEDVQTGHKMHWVNIIGIGIRLWIQRINRSPAQQAREK